MPKRNSRNKKFRQLSETPRPYGQRAPFIVKDLLAKAGITSKGISQFAEAQDKWLLRLRETLEPTLLQRVTGTGFDAGVLTVYVESAAWSVRLRYALAEALPALQAIDDTLKSVSVRLRARAAPSDSVKR